MIVTDQIRGERKADQREGDRSHWYNSRLGQYGVGTSFRKLPRVVLVFFPVRRAVPGPSEVLC